MKIEPNAGLRGAARSMFELFTALTDAGFTETQALIIIANLVSQLRPNP